MSLVGVQGRSEIVSSAFRHTIFDARCLPLVSIFATYLNEFKLMISFYMK
jgi:hypothetical protein